jgi:hypothetical protein
MTPKLAVALVIAGLTLAGWVVRGTWAQNPPQAPGSATTAAPPATEVAPLLPPGSDGQTVVPAPVVTSGSSIELVPGTGIPATGQSDDPEKNVQAFLEQNRKVAEGQLKNLKDEAEKLRSRLQKVEAGIKRWEALLAALQNSELEPSDLQPISGTRRQFSARAVPSAVSGPKDETPPREAGSTRRQAEPPPSNLPLDPGLPEDRSSDRPPTARPK